MNWLDIVLAILIGLSVLTSYRKGLSREIIGLVAGILALVLGAWFYGTAGSFLIRYVSSPRIAHFAGFCLVVIGVLALGGAISHIVGRFLQVTGLSFVDHALGAGFGLLRGTLIGVALVMGMMAFSQGDQPPNAVVESRLAPYVVDTARLFASMAPHELKEGFHKSYAQVKEAWSNAIQRNIPTGKKEKNERQI